MDIGIFTICYNGYGKYIQKWCESIADSTVLPTMATVALFGKEHGLSDELANKCKTILPCLNIVHCGDNINIGSNRNKAVENTNTEWLMLLSADDILLPEALKEIAKRDNPDIEAIAVAYMEERVNLTERYWPVPRTFEKNAMLDWRGYWLSPYSPFRRSFWEKYPYADCEFPNYLQTFAFARAEARFARVDKPCVRYIRRKTSHSRGRTKEEHDVLVKMLDNSAKTYESEAIKYRLKRLKKAIGR